MKPTLIALLALCLVGCQSPELPPRAESPAHKKLAADAHRILKFHCAQCHGKGNSQSDEMLLEFEALIKGRFIRPGNAARSKLYKIIARGDMPRAEKDAPPGFFPRYDLGGPAVSAPELEILKRWIDAGALRWE
jgi:mono/diheme cytochrome c family protein